MKGGNVHKSNNNSGTNGLKKRSSSSSSSSSVHHHHNHSRNGDCENRKNNGTFSNGVVTTSSLMTMSCMDSLHNDELPCCQPLQEIAQEVLPPPTIDSRRRSLNHLYNHDDDNDHNVEFNNHKASMSSFPTFHNNIYSSQGFVQMIREFLWHKYKQRQQLIKLDGANTQNGSSPKDVYHHDSFTTTTNNNNNHKKKRKKKKKKKSKLDMPEGSEQTILGDNHQSTTATATIQQPPSTKTLFSVNDDPDNDDDNQEQYRDEEDHTMDKPVTANMERIVTHPLQSSLSEASAAVPALDWNPPLDHHHRDWWIHGYLDRCSDARNHNNHWDPDCEEEQPALQIRQFLKFLSQKITFEPPEEVTSPGSPRNNKPQNNYFSNNNNNNSPLHNTTRPMGGNVTPKQKRCSYCQISQKDLETLALRVECFACRSRVNNFLSNFTCIPLYKLDEMGGQGDGRRQSSLLHQQQQQQQHPHDYVAMMEEGNISTQHNNYYYNNNCHWRDLLDNDDENNGPSLVLQAVKTEKGETIGWQFLKKTKTQMAEPISKSNQYSSSHPPPGEESQSDPLSQHGLTEDDVWFLLREFFLLPALSYDQWVDASNILENPEKIQAITQTVDERNDNILNELTSGMTDLLHQRETLNSMAITYDLEATDDAFFWNVNDNNNSAVVDMKTPVLLFDVETAVCGVFGKLLRILLQVTRAYQEVMWEWNRAMAESATSSKDPQQQQQPRHRPSFRMESPSRLIGDVSAIVGLWEPYLNALSQLLDASCGFERDLFQLADRQGSLKPFFFCPRSRQLLARLVQTKRNIVFEAIEAIRRNLDEQKDMYETPAKVYRTTFLRSILTQHRLLQVVRRDQHQRAVDDEGRHAQQQQHIFAAAEDSSLLPLLAMTNGGSTPGGRQLEILNSACEDVLLEIRHSWTETVRPQSNISQFQEAYEMKREKLARLVRIAFQVLDQHEELRQQKQVFGIKRDDTTRDQTHDANENNVLFQKMQKNHSDDLSLENSLFPVAWSQWVPKVECMIRRWLVLSTATRWTDDSSADIAPLAKPIVMPQRLIQWMSSEGLTDIRSHALRCPGSDGSLRATCLIMTLIHGWFVDKYNEWQAELAEDELLRSMNSKSGNTARDSSEPNGRKKSKKKQQKAKAFSSAENANSPSDDKAKQHQEQQQNEPKEGITTANYNGEGSQRESSVQGQAEEEALMPPSDGAIINPLHWSSGALRSEKSGVPVSVENSGIKDVSQDNGHSSTESSPSKQNSSRSLPPLDLLSSDLGPNNFPSPPPTVEATAENKLNCIVAVELDFSDFASFSQSPSENQHSTNAVADDDTVKLGNGRLKTSEHESKRYEDYDLLSYNASSTIGVLDGSKFIPAQEFLRQRFLKIAKLSDDEGHPIVHVGFCG